MVDKDIGYGQDYKFIPATSVASGMMQEIAEGVLFQTIQIVNIGLITNREQSKWMLIDAGMPGSADDILETCERILGPKSKPEGIILTHGHFDHVGALIELLKEWEVPVYVHPDELPFVTGELSYPEPDPSVEGGLIAKISPMFPNEPVNIGNYARAIPSDGSVPELAEWRWIHTPGHTPGHISLFRERDRVLVAGDAFVTVKQDSLYKVLTQKQEINGPPRYFTTDWEQAWNSVKKLASLNPDIALTGHGLPVSGDKLSAGLDKLAQEFDKLAIPDFGRYIDEKPYS